MNTEEQTGRGQQSVNIYSVKEDILTECTLEEMTPELNLSDSVAFEQHDILHVCHWGYFSHSQHVCYCTPSRVSMQYKVSGASSMYGASKYTQGEF